MTIREPIEVTVEIGGQEVAAGTLWTHEQRTETATFRYSDSYLASPVSYDLDPALPKSAGVFQSRPGKPLTAPTFPHDRRRYEACANRGAGCSTGG